MRVELRETGSIVLRVPKKEVLDVLQRSVRAGEMVAPDRLESEGSTYVVQESAQGTRVIHARRGDSSVPRATRDREELRRTVESDLFRLRQLFEVR